MRGFWDDLIRPRSILVKREPCAETGASVWVSGCSLRRAGRDAAGRLRCLGSLADEKQAIKEGKTAHEIWPDEPNKAAQKDTYAPSRGLQANHCRAAAGP